jgi:hypothetical protein
MALVAPDERAAAAGFTASARSLAQALSPALSGIALARAASGLPFYVAGGLKILYDLLLLRWGLMQRPLSDWESVPPGDPARHDRV